MDANERYGRTRSSHPADKFPQGKDAPEDQAAERRTAIPCAVTHSEKNAQSPKRRLIIADVHANLPAFEAVLASAGHWDEVWFLGDIVGYGPFPCECTELLQSLGAHAVIGNHDGIIQSGTHGSLWDRWTAGQLTEQQRIYLSSLPKEQTVEGTYMIHCPKDIRYFHPGKTALADVEKAFADRKEKRIFFGHCHHRMDFYGKNKEYHCIRAVGQMRDFDPRAGYTIEENGILAHYRTAYDVEKLLWGLDRVGLESDFLQKWKKFVRTGYDEDWSRY